MEISSVIYAMPILEGIDLLVLKLIKEQRERLRMFTEANPKRWMGSMRKNTFARAIQGSNSIEGYNATIDEAVAAVENEGPIEESDHETWQAIKGYRDAMTCILQACNDPYFELSKQFIKSLHFMMISFDMDKMPGRWRPGGIFVVDHNGETVYRGPDAELVEPLMDELVTYLNLENDDHKIVRAAMAHLNLTMIHPFKDGNGRMARAVQTLILGLETGVLHPVFSSIEEWLGSNTDEYYKVLAEVGKGAWNPSHSALPWIRFCLRAHYQQAATLIRRVEEIEELYSELEKLVKLKKLPERTVIPLLDACIGMRLTNTRYRTETEVSEFVASRELKRLCEENLLEPMGQNRGRTYSATKELMKIRQRTRIERQVENPYDVAQKQMDERQLSLLDMTE